MKIIKFKFKNFIFIAFMAFVFSINLNFVFADTDTTASTTTRGTGGLVPCVNDCEAEDLFGSGTNDANKPPIWTTLIRSALGISGIFILLMFVVGGIMIMVSGGDKSKIKTATNIMKSSIVGLLIVVFAYTVVRFVVMALVDKDNWKIFFGG